MSNFKIEINDRPVIEALNQLAAAGQDLTPAMRAISMALLSQTEANFAAEAGPLGKWPALAQSTVEGRVGKVAGKTKGGWRKDGRLSKGAAGKAAGMKILQDTGRLAASVTPFWSETEAGVGSNAIYAAIHQLGGQAGRNLKSLIPARPYLPGTEAGLQDGMEERVLDTIQEYLLRGG
jgi:phage gpG-like protein